MNAQRINLTESLHKYASEIYLDIKLLCDTANNFASLLEQPMSISLRRPHTLETELIGLSVSTTDTKPLKERPDKQVFRSALQAKLRAGR
jgi:hypothetical protein